MIEWAVSFLAVPLFSLYCIYVVGKQFDLWDKIQSFMANHGSGRMNFRDVGEGVKSVRFEGIGKLFRRD